MSKYFKNVKSYKDLKEQYKKLLKANHPDNGGVLETMQEINVEYDALFSIWKDRAEANNSLAEGEKEETANSTRRTFYTAYGWEGSRYDSSLTLKEIAKIARTYVKEKYPTCKFSIRTSYGSMCQALRVELLEFPEQMYMTAEQLREVLREEHTYIDNGKTQKYTSLSDIGEEVWRKLYTNDIFTASNWTDEELLNCYNKTVFEENKTFYAVNTEYFQSVIDDVNAFVASYNYNDSDGQIDYFDVNFYDGKVKYRNCKYVPKVARIKNKTSKPATKKKTVKESAPELEAVAEKNSYTYKITLGEDTRDGSTLWVVRINEKLNRDEYIAENKAMKERGAYYSKFKHGFIFRFDPSEILSHGREKRA